ncbi:hypothetical protein Tco_0622246 [Tanacetum coccineum]
MVVPVEEVYVEALQVKYLIIDWEKFDRDDLDKLWSLVKKIFSSTDPTNDKERTLWVELKRLFEPGTDDILWKLHRYMHDPLTWRLYDTCGVHHVSTDRGHDIFMTMSSSSFIGAVYVGSSAINFFIAWNASSAAAVQWKLFVQKEAHTRL